ncbi:MAG: PP2C family protein-serine/threonine phosphatase [Pyrinomonadaceae bacterium]
MRVEIEMKPGVWGESKAKAGQAYDGACLWLRRVMPRVAVAAGVLFVLRAFASDLFGEFYRRSFVGTLLDVLTWLLVAPTVIYYGYKTLRWLKRKLLWRVRRRLIITYLFVGLTPIVLLAGLGFLFGYSMALNSMADAVMKEVGATERETLANARALADALAALPAGAANDDARAQAWLDERDRLLQASLPGARLAVWRDAAGGAEESWTSTLSRPARFKSEPAGEQVRALGDAQTPAGAPLPEWLRGRKEWSGLVLVPSSDPQAFYASPSLRALVRREVEGRSLTLLVTVPVSRALVERLREDTGIRVRPAFSNRTLFQTGGQNRRASGDGEPKESTEAARGDDAGRQREQDRAADQLGEEWANETHAIVIMPATNWLDGQQGRYITYRFPSTLAAARQYALDRGYLGQNIQLNYVLLSFVTVFLVFELLALIAAGWMTRAVTGTVHKLYRATEHVKLGDFSHRVHVRSHDQLGELAGAFNEMSDNIESLLHERVMRERLEREVEIAAEVQMQLFPRAVPRLEGAELVGECRAARGVAGDYYDYAEIVPGLVAVALGDVSGKGISASLVMSNLQASLRAQVTILAERYKRPEPMAAVAAGEGTSLPLVEFGVPRGVTGVGDACAVESMAASLNDQLCRSTDDNRFATFFLALYDDRARTLRYTNAGHNDPILVRAVDGSHERLNAGGTVLGAFEWARYEEASATLAPGDLLFIFSDGLSEAQNALGEEYGEQRLVQFVVARRKLSADELRRQLFTEIDEWSGQQERGDDQTIVILKAC